MRRELLVALGLGVAVAAAAHRPAADEVIAELAGERGRAAGVVSVKRDPNVPRLLLVRVGAGWYALAPERRLALADAWRTHWREAVPDGLVGVLDETTGRPAVNYDGRGRARLPPPTPP